MQWLKSKKWLVCLLCALFVMTPIVNTGWAQPEEEEEEEPLQARPNPMDKTTLQGRTGITMQSGGANWDPFDKSPASKGQQLIPGQSLQNKMGASGKSGLLKPGNASPGSMVGKELGDDIVDPAKKTGATMTGPAGGVDPGGSVGKVVGDDIVNPVKKTGKAMVGGQITK
jgi:hypothetical protein